jgi:integrase
VPKRIKTRDPEIFIIGKSYFFRGTINGERVDDMKLEGTSYSLAADAKRKLIQELEATGVKGRKSSAGNLMDKYVKAREVEKQLGKISDSTFRETKRLIENHLKPALGKERVAKLNATVWNRYDLSKKLDTTQHAKVLKHFLGWCVSEDVLKFVPKLEAKEWDRRERINLTDSEIDALLGAALVRRGNLPDIIVIAVTMGKRVNEISQLHWDQVDFENDVLFLGKKNTKTKKRRAIPMPKVVRERLMLRANETNSEFVFPNMRDLTRPMSKTGYAQVFRSIRKAAGINPEIQMHDLRATAQGRSHSDARFTDAQRQDFFGSAAEVQRDIYVKLQAKQLKGMENVVQTPMLEKLNRGNRGEKTRKKKASRGVSV